MGTVNQSALWAPVVASAVTGAISLLSLVIVQWWSTEREREARAREHEQRREERRTDFLAKTLMDLQDASLRMGVARLREHGGRRPVELERAESEVVVFAARVPDVELKALVGELIQASPGTAHASSAEEFLARNHIHGEVFVQVNRRIGNLLDRLHPHDGSVV